MHAPTLPRALLFMPKTLSQKQIAGFGGALVVLLVGGFAYYWQLPPPRDENAPPPPQDSPYYQTSVEAVGVGVAFDRDAILKAQSWVKERLRHEGIPLHEDMEAPLTHTSTPLHLNLEATLRPADKNNPATVTVEFQVEREVYANPKARTSFPARISNSLGRSAQITKLGAGAALGEAVSQATEQFIKEWKAVNR